ncbi:MAG: hypothetical protein QOE57_2488 [Acidimicrobiaceae bacterium]|nr:hypothetical protein [Acidimicrobiaceae bacterium]
MITDIKASFEVTNWTEEPFDQRTKGAVSGAGPGSGAGAGAGSGEGEGEGAKMTTATVTKVYSGDIDGDSVTEWLMAYAADGSASFVGLERVNGTVGERRGTIVLQHVGTFKGGAATAELTVVAGCGTGELAQATGRGDFLADPAGKIRLELDFD